MKKIYDDATVDVTFTGKTIATREGMKITYLLDKEEIWTLRDEEEGCGILVEEIIYHLEKEYPLYYVSKIEYFERFSHKIWGVILYDEEEE